MEAVLTHTPHNAAQLFVLQTLATARSEQDKEELTSLYLDYIQRKLDNATDKWWTENEMTNEKLEVILNSHQRVQYH
jgi:hypothetical protein